MPERISQGVAIRVPFQAFLASDHIAPATGLTTTIVITISKNGAAYAATNAAETSHEIGNGSYYADLNATDTGTVGPLFVRGAVATMDPSTVIYDVVVDTPQTGDSFARIGALGAGLTGITGATLAAAYDAAKTASQVVATDIVSGGAITTSGGIASADVKKQNNATVYGTGVAGDLWRGSV